MYIYTLPLKSLGSVRFFMFLRESLLFINAEFIWSKRQKKNGYFVKYYCNLKCSKKQYEAAQQFQH